MTVQLNYDIEVGEDLIDLVIPFSAEVYMDSTGIGSYEFWGQKCHDRGESYPAIDGDIEYPLIYSQEVLDVIEKELDRVEEMIIQKYEADRDY